MTRESPGGYETFVKEATYQGEIEVYEVVYKFIKGRKYYIIAFQIGLIKSHTNIQ